MTDLWATASAAAERLDLPQPYAGLYFSLSVPLGGLYALLYAAGPAVVINESGIMFVFVLNNNLHAALPGAHFDVEYDAERANTLGLNFFREQRFEEGEREQLGLLVRQAWLETSADQDTWIRLEGGVTP